MAHTSHSYIKISWDKHKISLMKQKNNLNDKITNKGRYDKLNYTEQKIQHNIKPI